MSKYMYKRRCRYCQKRMEKIEKKLKLQTILIMANVIKVIAFIVLAIFFQKWWLSLISVFFMTTPQEFKEITK